MSGVRARAVAELERRVAGFPRELQQLEAAVKAGADGLGIHASQVSVLGIMMRELHARQLAFLARLTPDVAGDAFADSVASLHFEEITGAQKIWSLFARAFAARARPDLAPLLDAADLVAADCYLHCTAAARNFGVLDPDALREPPLVCVESYPEAIALGRRDLLGLLCDAGWRFHDLRLPIPLVLLPADQVGCIWTLPALCHEVGHDVDKDLGLTPELAAAIDEGAVPPERRATWQRWTAEILADALGLLLGNAGFARSIAELLLVLAPGSRYRELDPEATHPHPLVRVALAAAMLRRLGVPALADLARELDEEAGAIPAPAGVAPFLGDLAEIAAVFTDRSLRALGGHALAEMGPALASDVKRTAALAEFLASGALRPPPDKPSRFPYRLVPAAAQLAVDASPPGPGTLSGVQGRAMEFVAAIPRPPMLDGGPRIGAARAACLARMAREIDFAEARRDG